MRKKKILIVEDEAITAMDIKSQLIKLGYDVLEIVLTGEDAIRLAEILHPHLILMDIVLGQGMSGSEAARIILEKFRIPIIYLTAYSDEKTLEEAKISAPFGYLTKPFDSKLLWITIEIALYKHQMEIKLLESEERFRHSFEHAAIGMALVSLSGNILKTNHALQKILGFSEEEFQRRKIEDITCQDDILLEERMNKEMIQQKMESFQLEKRFYDRNGNFVWILLTTSLVRDASAHPLYFIHQIQDLSSRKKMEEQISHLAHFDSLTGLPNRKYLEEFINQSLSVARNKRQYVAFLVMNIDRFKLVNEVFGHETGDLLLQAVTVRLRTHLSGNDLLARIGGDELVVILTRLNDKNAAASTARHIIEILTAPFFLNEQKFFLSSCMGIALYPENGETGNTLIKNAYVALEHAKSQGSSIIEFCTPEMSRRTRERMEIEQQLKQAIEKKEFLLCFQPKASLHTGEITGIEALIRWYSLERGLLFPLKFIPIAEESDLIFKITSWLLQYICELMDTLKKESIPLVPISFNLSPQDFLQTNMVHLLKDLLEEYNIDPAYLEIEITERTLMQQDASASLFTLNTLKEMGLIISIDDFGIGYTSFNYLRQFKPSKLKIDQFFIQEIGNTDHHNPAIIEAMISMGHALGMKIVGEGVETREQLNFLIKAGCDEMQGYYFSHPLSVDEIKKFLKEGRKLDLLTHDTRESPPNKEAI